MGLLTSSEAVFPQTPPILASVTAQKKPQSTSRVTFRRSWAGAKSGHTLPPTCLWHILGSAACVHYVNCRFEVGKREGDGDTRPGPRRRASQFLLNFRLASLESNPTRCSRTTDSEDAWEREREKKKLLNLDPPLAPSQPIKLETRTWRPREPPRLALLGYRTLNGNSSFWF